MDIFGIRELEDKNVITMFCIFSVARKVGIKPEEFAEIIVGNVDDISDYVNAVTAKMKELNQKKGQN